MFKKNAVETTKLDEAIDSAFRELSGYHVTEESYGAAVDHIAKLYKIKSEHQDKNQVSKDVVVTGAVNLIGIFAILGYERTQIITSKAIGFVTKLR